MDLKRLNPFGRKSEYQAEHEFLERFIRFVKKSRYGFYYSGMEPFPEAEQLKSSRRAVARVACAFAERIRDRLGDDHGDRDFWIDALLRELMSKGGEFEDAELMLLTQITNLDRARRFPRDVMARIALRHYKQVGLTPRSRRVLEETLRAFQRPGLHFDAEDRKQIFELQQAIQGHDDHVPPVIEDWQVPFADSPVLSIAIHAFKAKSAKPTAKWLKEAREILAKHDPEALIPRFEAMLEGVRKLEVPSNPLISDELRGLCLMLGIVEHPAVPTLLGQLLVATGHKLSGYGPRSQKAFGACLYALAELGTTEALTQLARAKGKIATTTLQNNLKQTLQAAAVARGVTVAELEELVVPTFDLDANSQREWVMDDLTATLTVSPDGVSLTWARDGRPLKSKPTLPEAHKATGAEITKLKKEIESSLTAQRARIESQFLQERMHDYPIWRERYLDHPLLQSLSRRLIWRFIDADREIAGIWADGELVDVEGRPIQGLGDDTLVQLWHPLDQGIRSVEAWREYLVSRELVQPLKQAHREVYLLTDAERNTARYSNRFAAHVLKQHQCAALMRQRGWKVQLQGYFDADFAPPSLTLEDHGLIVEFFVQMPEPGTDREQAFMTDVGIATFVLTDQVRFKNLRGETLNIDTIPPKVFTEVMRDVDLFVGVSSIGNDPTWADRGEFAGYWREFAFAPELSASAITRRVVLERLLPRLAFGPISKIDGNFLTVQGKLRSYKIHLGSGNILMSPNNQYLCIVPDRGNSKGMPYLPFEGDGTLAVIISKALLLMNDDKITDPTIVSQIRH